MISTAIVSSFGFLFWIIVARKYNTDQIGFATVLISSATFVGALSMLGFDAILIRFLSKSNKKNSTISLSFLLTSIIGLIIALIYIIFAKTISPPISKLIHGFYPSALFIIVVLIFIINFLIESILIAFRSAKYILIKNSIYSIFKLLLPFLIIGLGTFGIFLSNGIAIIAAVFFGLYILVKKFKYRPASVLSIDNIKEMTRFGSINYIAGLSSNFTNTMLPLIILNNLGASQAAYFFMSYTIANLLNVVPSSVAQSLLAEGSQNESDWKNATLKSLSTILLILLPAIVILFFFGGLILQIFGKNYSTEGIVFLRILSVSSIFVSINYIGDALLKLRKHNMLFLFMNTINTGGILILSIIFVTHGLRGIGLAWLISQTITTIIYFFIFLPNILKIKLTHLQWKI